MIAFVIAVPLTWWFMHSWLQKYEYRVDINVWIFGVVGFAILLLALAIVSANTIGRCPAKPGEKLTIRMTVNANSFQR